LLQIHDKLQIIVCRACTRLGNQAMVARDKVVCQFPADAAIMAASMYMMDNRLVYTAIIQLAQQFMPIDGRSFRDGMV
jgi:hypothetical protein